jgi:hypothetical protein
MKIKNKGLGLKSQGLLYLHEVIILHANPIETLAS